MKTWLFRIEPNNLLGWNQLHKLCHDERWIIQCPRFDWTILWGWTTPKQKWIYIKKSSNKAKNQRKNLKKNSALRVERRKRGSAQRATSSSHEAEGDRELSSAGVRSRGRRPRILTAWESKSRSPSAKCCELYYANLHDRFRLEVRILFYPMSTSKLAVWVTLIIAGMRWCIQSVLFA